MTSVTRRQTAIEQNTPPQRLANLMPTTDAKAPVVITPPTREQLGLPPVPVNPKMSDPNVRVQVPTPIRNKTLISIVQNPNGTIALTDFALIEKLLSANQGVFIGETHTEKVARDFLIKNMGRLKSNGVKVLFLECIEKKNQKLIDAYFNAITPEQEAVALNNLIVILKSTWGWAVNEYISVIKEAKLNNIQVVGIDERNGPLHADLIENKDDRELTWRNGFWAKTVENHIKNKPGKKFIVLGGAQHSKNNLDYKISAPFGMKSPYFGVNYALGIPSIEMTMQADKLGTYKATNNKSDYTYFSECNPLVCRMKKFMAPKLD
jgi:hypothetical protein